MNDDIKVSRWAVGLGVTILLFMVGQTWLAARWTGQVNAGLDAVREAQIETKRELKSDIAATKADLAASESRMNRRIERLEDFDRNRKTLN